VGLLVADSVVQAGVGGAVGLLCASMTLALLRQLAPPDTWYEIPARPTWTVVAFTAGLAIVTGLVVGLLPALRAASIPVASAIRSRMSLGDRAAGRGRTMLVVAQVAMTLALLTVASLVGASLARVLRVDPGFTTTGLLIADFRLPASRYDSAPSRTAFYDQLVERLEALPGASRACVANDVPLDTEQGGMTWVAEGDPGGRMIGSTPKVASPGCFEVLGIPLLAGRLFESRDDTPEVIISQSMARSLWPDEPEPFNPVGRRIHMGTADGWPLTVVGLVGDIRNSALESDYRRQVWLAHSFGFWPPERAIVSRETGNRSLDATMLRRVMGDLDPTIAVANVRTMDDIVASATASRRFVLFLLGGFGVVALLLSGVGIYGVLAHAVSQRTSEIGVRMALGATRRDIARLITGRLVLSVVAGTVLGVLIAFTSSTWVASLLYETSATDVRVYAGVAAFVALVAGAAAWSPTRRAVQVDPLGALRQD
jgi:predicted permease